MAITQGMCTSFKTEVLQGIHVFGTDVFKVCLITSAATAGATTTNYSDVSAYEVPDSGTYVAGGQILATVSVTSSGVQALVDWSTDPSWTSATITARGALIYNSSKSNKAVAVLDFGSDKSSTASTFSMQLPAATASNAIVRIE